MTPCAPSAWAAGSPASRRSGSDDGRLHVRVGRHTNHLASPDDRSKPLQSDSNSGVIIHRSLSTDTRSTQLPIDSVETALLHVATCQSRDNAVAMTDSALNTGMTSVPRLQRLVAGMTARHREVLRLSDASAQSGLESKARLRLRALNIPYRTQVYFAGVGKVDLLIGDRIVLELDGRTWHSTEADSLTTGGETSFTTSVGGRSFV